MALIVASTKAAYRAGSPLYPAVHHVAPENDPPVLSATGATGVVSWSDGGAGGTFTPATGAAGIVYKPANHTKGVTLTATDSGAGGSGQTNIVITGTFPIQPHLGYDIDLDDDTVVKKMRDGTGYYQIDAPPFEGRPLQFIDREWTEYDVLRAFWDFHRKTISFYYIDVEAIRTYLVKFISGLKARPNESKGWDMSCTIDGKIT